MLTVKKNNVDKWELLLRVLSDELSEDDLIFQSWLQESQENAALYQSLRRGYADDDVKLDKDKMYHNMAEILSFNHHTVPLIRNRWFLGVATVAVLLITGLTCYLTMYRAKPTDTATVERQEVNVFEPGSKKAYLVSSNGESIDLSESFEIVKEDGTVISNDPQGIVSVNKNATEVQRVENHTLYVPRGGEYTLVLADGSKVHLNSETTLVFPSRFEGDTRDVELTGEAYFEVKKHAMPFIVHTAEMQIEVFGTSFNVNAYRNNALTSATLVEGVVRIRAPDMAESIPVQPGENVSIDRVSNEISIKKVDTAIYTAWVKGEFIFRNSPLEDILAQLSRWYDFTVEYENPSIRKMKFTGSAEKARTLDYLLDMIKTVTDVKYRYDNGVIVLYK